jgi:hypothetical protein
MVTRVIGIDVLIERIVGRGRLCLRLRHLQILVLDMVIRG